MASRATTHDGYPSTPTGGRLDDNRDGAKDGLGSRYSIVQKFHTGCVCGALSPSAAAEVHIVDPQSLSFGNVSGKLLRESFWCVLMGVRGIDQPADV